MPRRHLSNVFVWEVDLMIYPAMIAVVMVSLLVGTVRADDDFEPIDLLADGSEISSAGGSPPVGTPIGTYNCNGFEGFSYCDPTTHQAGGSGAPVRPDLPPDNPRGIGVNQGTNPHTMYNSALAASLGRAQSAAASADLTGLCASRAQGIKGCLCTQLVGESTKTTSSATPAVNGFFDVKVCVERTVRCVAFCPAAADAGNGGGRE